MSASIDREPAGGAGRRGRGSPPGATRPTAAEALRVLLANSEPNRLDRTARIVAELGHTVVGQVTEIDAVERAVVERRPDIVLVLVLANTVASPASARHALHLVTEIVHVATCPVVALMDAEDPEWVAEASARGIAAYVSPVGRDQIGSALHIARRRFGEYQSLEHAFERRAVTERAKGVLMERHQIGEREAFEMLRRQARGSGQRVADLAVAVLRGHRLL